MLFAEIIFVVAAAVADADKKDLVYTFAADCVVVVVDDVYVVVEMRYVGDGCHIDW